MGNLIDWCSRLPNAVIYEVTHWFQKRFHEIALQRRLEEGLRGFRAIASLSVFFKWKSGVGGFVAWLSVMSKILSLILLQRCGT